MSFAHGSNDGQKGMGLIMLILIGVVPTAYALNRAMPDSEIAAVPADVDLRRTDARSLRAAAARSPIRARRSATTCARASTTPAVAAGARAVCRATSSTQVEQYGSLRLLPAQPCRTCATTCTWPPKTIRRLGKEPTVSLVPKADAELLKFYRSELDGATRFIPTWVKIAVAIALGLGTMVGWKRIVVTVGEKIGKSHLTYAQGASAELVAAATIAAADIYGLPVSTTHVLSSGVAGTMAASRSGLQMATVRNLLLAWVLTLPAAILLAGSLFWLFAKVF